MTSPYPLPTLPLVPPSISVRFLTSSEIDSLNKAYDSQNYAFCISAGVYFISQTPQLADPAKFSVWELVGDSQYAIGKVRFDANRARKHTHALCGLAHSLLLFAFLFVAVLSLLLLLSLRFTRHSTPTLFGLTR